MPLTSSKKRAYAVKTTVVYVLLVAGMIMVTLPFFWMVSTSFKARWAVFAYPVQWIPNPFVWQNYPQAFAALPIGRFMWNTCVIAFWRVIGVTLSSSMAAYAFARLEWRGREPLFLVVLATLMLPGQVTLIPEFIAFKLLGWLDTYLPLVVPAFLGGGAFDIFLLRQFFKTISRELDDAAKIDGCSRLAIYWRIILPLSKPALITVILFTFEGSWMDFFGPLIYLFSMDKFPISLGLRLFEQQRHTDWAQIMAVTNISIIPILVLYYYGQKYFVQGIVFTGVKG